MPTPITQKGYDALKAELDRLRKVERPKNIEAIAEARAHGDLSENAEYDAAKERQGFIAARIAELETKIAEARVVDTTGRTTETVVFGATVLVIEQEVEVGPTFGAVMLGNLKWHRSPPGAAGRSQGGRAGGRCRFRTYRSRSRLTSISSDSRRTTSRAVPSRRKTTGGLPILL